MTKSEIGKQKEQKTRLPKSITLQQWIENGGNMLSNWAVIYACKDLGCACERELRNTQLSDVMTSRLAGLELKRFMKDNPSLRLLNTRKVQI